MKTYPEQMESENVEKKSIFKLWHFIVLFIFLLVVVAIAFLLSYPALILKPLADIFFTKDVLTNGLNLTSEDIEKLRNNDPGVKDLVFLQINGLLRRQFKDDDDATVLIDQGDIQMEAEYPDKEFSSSCDLKLSALHPKISGSLLKSSNISTGLSFDEAGVQAFMEATLDAIVNVDFDFRAEIGIKILKKCKRVLRETLGIDLTTTGKVLIAVKISGENVRIETEENKLLLKFDLDFDLEGKPFDWNVDNVDVSKCDVKLGNKVKIGSYCNFATGLIKEGAQKYLDKWTVFQAPKLVKKLEDKLQKKIGDEMSFPIVKF